MILIFDVFGVAYLEAGLNQLLLESVQVFRAKGSKIYFASNMEATQKALFWNALNLKAYGEEIFCSGELEVAKPAPAFYSRLTSAIGADPDSILFFDDSAANVEAAIRSGWQGFLYTDVETTLTQIEKYNGI